MDVRFQMFRESFEVFPSIFFWWRPQLGIAIGWLIWSLQIRFPEKVAPISLPLFTEEEIDKVLEDITRD